MKSKKILVLYDYFDPAYKAGGPIRSLVNLVQLMEESADFYVLASNRDHDGTTLSVPTDRWIDYGKSSHVMYLSHGKKAYFSMKKIIDELGPDVVYINGIFSLWFVVFPLLCLKASNATVVIAPRGMLQTGALQIKATKKLVYLKVLKYLLKKQSSLIWHATDLQEFEDIEHFASGMGCIIMAGNVPKFHETCSLALPISQSHKFVSISLLTTKKNHMAFLHALSQIPTQQEITYHIFGPVSDVKYFEKLKVQMAAMPPHIIVEYKGFIHPEDVADTLREYDFYVLTSFGENFGHSIFEAFNQGIPVIISDQTPWRNLHQKQVGWDIDINDQNALKNAIVEAVSMDNKTYSSFRKGARKVAEDYMDENNFVLDYQQLFGLK